MCICLARRITKFKIDFFQNLKRLYLTMEPLKENIFFGFFLIHMGQNKLRSGRMSGTDFSHMVENRVLSTLKKFLKLNPNFFYFFQRFHSFSRFTFKKSLRITIKSPNKESCCKVKRYSTRIFFPHFYNSPGSI